MFGTRVTRVTLLSKATERVTSTGFFMICHDSGTLATYPLRPEAQYTRYCRILKWQWMCPTSRGVGDSGEDWLFAHFPVDVICRPQGTGRERQPELRDASIPASFCRDPVFSRGHLPSLPVTLQNKMLKRGCQGFRGRRRANCLLPPELATIHSFPPKLLKTILSYLIPLGP